MSAFFARNNKDAKILEIFITEDTNCIRKMNHNPVYKESFENFAFNSNNYWFVAAGSNARHYLFFKADWMTYLVISKNWDI